MSQSIDHNSMTTNFPYPTNSNQHHPHLINGFYSNNNINNIHNNNNIQSVARLNNGFSNSHMDIEGMFS